MNEQCGASSPMGAWACKRPRGHGGDHSAISDETMKPTPPDSRDLVAEIQTAIECVDDRGTVEVHTASLKAWLRALTEGERIKGWVPPNASRAFDRHGTILMIDTPGGSTGDFSTRATLIIHAPPTGKES